VNIPDFQLNNYVVSTCPALEPAKRWQRVDVGEQEVYIGDGTYVISIIKHHPSNVSEMNVNCNKVNHVVIRYLQGEGFIGPEYLYIGLQEFNLNKPIDGLDYEG
jgi:hypothetical protein